MTRSEDYLKELEELLQTISTQRSDIADSRKELAFFKNLKIIDNGFKAALYDHYSMEISSLDRKVYSERCILTRPEY